VAEEEGIFTMNVTRSRALLLGFTALAGSLALAAPAFAVEAVAAATDTATAADTAGPKVEEVVVTGALRTQRLQDAPMAVTAVTAQEFQNSGFKEPRELQFLSPSIQVSIQGANAIYIRGSGTNSQNGGTEQSVGMVIDGVLMGFVDDIGGDISDLDHVEVYRGPQGTQFAKNASAGVVSMMTKKPMIGSFGVTAHGSYGEHNDTADDVTVNVPISDSMAARFTAGFQHRDGVFENVVRHENQGGREQKGLRGKFLWQPRDRVSFLLSADARLTYDKPNFPQAWGQCGPATTTPFINYTGTKVLPGCNGALAAGIVPSATNSKIVEQDDAYRHTEAGGVSLVSELPLGDFTLTSITAYRFMSRQFFGPSGSGIVTNSFLANRYNGGQASEELRISSPIGHKLTYVGGIFLYDRDTVTKSCSCGPAYQQAKLEYPNTPYGANVWVSAQGGQTKNHNVNKSYAAYTDGTYHFTDKLQLNAGFRVTYDDISAGITTVPVAGVYPSITTPNLAVNPVFTVLPYRFLATNHTGYTYRVGPQYFITPDIQVYGTYAHGYKGPLIDTSINVLDAIKPEEVDMFEGGLKSAWFDHRLTANVTLFHQQFKNYQVTVLNQQIVPNVFQLGNAGGMLSQGAELEFNARPLEDWALTASLSYNDSHYTDFVTSCWNANEPIKQATSGVNGCYVHPGNTSASTNAAGTPLINSSKYTYRVGGTYTHDFASKWRVDATANYFWRSGWLSAPMDPNITNPAYGVLALNGGVTTPDGRFRFGVFARNALNTFFLAGKQANNGGWTNVLNPEAVRTVGVNVTAKFE
jgi:iron complex outermembrane receptor protein